MDRMKQLEKIAIENDLWTKWSNEKGWPEKPGEWIKCDKSDPNSMPDHNSAAVLLYETLDD
jgi:hypothetical protein